MILSLIAMDSTYVLMGTNTGTIVVFDGYTHKMRHKLCSLHSPVLCLLYIKWEIYHAFWCTLYIIVSIVLWWYLCRTREGSAYICAGLANGKMAIYNHYSIGVSTTIMCHIHHAGGVDNFRRGVGGMGEGGGGGSYALIYSRKLQQNKAFVVLSKIWVRCL